MSNIYAAPNADLSADLSTSDTRLFEINGRIGRVRWIAYISAMYLLVSLLIGFFAVASSASRPIQDVVPLLTSLLLFAGFITICRRRLQDLGLGNWFLLLGIVPFVNLYFFFMMIFKRGDDGANEYGPAPAPNNRSVHLLAWIFPIFMMIGIVAAIALPAYQKYVIKARAAEAAQQR